MNDGFKWSLSTGKVVEDVLYSYASKYCYEDVSHSFKFNVACGTMLNSKCTSPISCQIFSITYRLRRKQILLVDIYQESRRSDMLFICIKGEVGCIEVGKKNIADNGTKEQNKLGLKVPKNAEGPDMDIVTFIS
ncbi:hypothetical protein BDA99DRAFT_571615 [Phascolomyces articulosus]|uniref:Uncharacterized protein n=1 Tax=Phascolomyces articulosus TaxID=60185 RepID=A0AAD5K154_9FUNG|nr:hypothetical protein BDA99DRAFT_571615 [Phascolomyces articulosus]